MDNIAVKASLPGYDADTCPDYRLLFSSVAPLLKIEKQGTFTISDVTQDVVIDTHTLGYVPLVIVYDTSDNKNTMESHYIGWDDTTITWLGDTLSYFGTGSKTIHYTIFRVKLKEAFSAEILNESEQSAGSSDEYGILVTLPGKDVSSTDLRDFVLHKDARSLQIHMIDYANHTTGIGWTEDVAHLLSYEPLFFFCFKAYYWDYWQLIESANQELTANSDISGIHLSGIYDGESSVIIFKDPFDLED